MDRKRFEELESNILIVIFLIGIIIISFFVGRFIEKSNSFDHYDSLKDDFYTMTTLHNSCLDISLKLIKNFTNCQLTLLEQRVEERKLKSNGINCNINGG